jgi:hypothetical protein
MFEQRNAFGYPVMPTKLEQAKQYAAAAILRNQPECACATCERERKLLMVQRLTRNWKKQ